MVIVYSPVFINRGHVDLTNQIKHYNTLVANQQWPFIFMIGRGESEQEGDL